jgi:cellulose synthase/poly-beta-1,6-N-acetylglucosamine synthase-like glycosyltransferase
MWIRRSVFDKVGGFRAGVAEDMDWSFRARDAGFQIGYEPMAVVRHLARSGWLELLTRWRRVLAEHYLLTREKPLGLLRWMAWTAGMPASIVPHLGRVLCTDRLSGGRVRAGAAWVLIAHRLWRTGYMTRLLLTSSRRARS